MKKARMLAAAGFGVMLFAPGGSEAGYEIYDPSVSTCRTNNCSSVFISGSVLAFNNSAARWEAAVYAFPGDCVRLDETVMAGLSSDDEMVVVGPNGTVWRNDDFTGNRPRVAFVAPNNGWYYVSIGHYRGLPIEHNLTIAYGRYAGGATNPNCANPTAPSLATDTATKPAAAAPTAEPGNAPGK